MVDFNMDSVSILATGLRFPEGPIALDDGSVLVTELGRSVAKIGPDGSITRFDCGGSPRS